MLRAVSAPGEDAAVTRGVSVRALIAHTNRAGEENLRKLEMRLLAAGVTVARTTGDLVRYDGKPSTRRASTSASPLTARSRRVVFEPIRCRTAGAIRKSRRLPRTIMAINQPIGAL
jgi:hypothetical protein